MLQYSTKKYYHPGGLFNIEPPLKTKTNSEKRRTLAFTTETQ